MAYKAGAAYVSVLPDFRGFHEKIGAELRGMDGDFARAGDRAGAKFMSGFKDRLRVGLTDLPKATIRADADTLEAKRKLDDAAKTRTAKIKVDTQLFQSKALWGVLGSAAVGPQALGLAAGAAGAGVAYGAAAAGVAAFGAVAVPMFKKVTAAQTALTAARKNYDKATTAAQRQTALRAEAAATDGLTVSEKRLGVQLTGLRGEWTKFQDRLQPQVASALVPWFATAKQDMGDLSPLIRDTSGAVHDLGQEAKIALAAPFWKKFFTDVGQTGGIALRAFGDSVGKVGDGLAHLFVTFKPDIDRLPGLIDKWAGSFDNWARSYKRSGFDAFMRTTFSPANLASLKGDGQALATVLGNVAKATAQMSPAAFLGLSKVLTILSKLSPGQIEAIGAIYAIGKVAGGGSGLDSILGKILGRGGKGAAAAGTEAAAASKGSRPGGYGNTALAAAAVVPIVDSVLAQMRSGSGGKNWLNNPFGTGSGSGWNNFGQAGRNAKNWLVTSPSNWLQTGFNFVTGGKSAGDGWMQSFIAAAKAKSGPGFGSVFDAIDADISKLDKHGHTFGGIVDNAKKAVEQAAAGAVSWLKKAGQQTADGYASGYKSRNAAVIAVVSGGTRGAALRGAAGAGVWLKPAGSTAAGGFASAFAGARSRIDAAVGRLKATVQNAGYGSETWLAPAGADVMTGFLGALEPGIAAVQTRLQQFTSQIPSWKGPPHRDANLLTPAGRLIMDSLLRGMKAGFAAVKAWTTGTASQIAGVFGRTEKELAADVRDKKISPAAKNDITYWLIKDNKKLQGIARERSKLLNKIAAAKAYGAGVTSTTESNYGILNAAAAATPNGGTASADSIIGELRLDANRVRQFGHDIVKLRKMGLNRAYINELVQDFTAGDTQAAAIAHEFATGPLSQIREANFAEGKIAQGSRYLGNQSANAMYEAAGQAGKGFLKGLEKQKRAIDALMRRIADDMVKELKKRLGIHSPATALIPVGEWSGEGVAVGMERKLGRIRQAAAAMAGAVIPRPGLALPGVGSALAAGAIEMRVTYDGPSNGALAAIVKDLRYTIQHNSGGDVQKYLGHGKVRT